MGKRRLLWGLVLLSMFGLVACQGNAAPASGEQTVVVTDALGREVTLAALPQRIIIGGRANFMLNDAIYLFPDAPERVLALTKANQAATAFVTLLDPEAEAKIRFMADAAAEEIAAADPDLVLLKSYMQEALGAPLEQLGIPVLYFDFETPEQYERDLGILGQALGNAERAAEIWTYYRDIMDRMAEGTANLTAADKPRVLLLQYSESGGEVAFKVPPVSWIQTQMVELAGGIPIWKEAAQGGGWAVVNLEQIAAWNPEQVYVINYFGSAAEIVAQLQADPQWSELAAVRNEQLFGFASDFHSWDQPDTRWGLGLLWLAQRIQPDAFAAIDMEAETLHFFETLYGLERDVIEAEILSRTGDLAYP